MEKSLDAKEIYKLFCEYHTLPEEEYPKCFYMDKKTGKVFDPETKKPADSKRFPPPKKKKKKKGDPKLVIPDWAVNINYIYNYFMYLNYNNFIFFRLIVLISQRKK